MRIRHLVCTDNFAGVERYITTASVELARRGHDVEIFGGRPAAMRSALGYAPVEFLEASGARAALGLSLRGPKPDLVHAHMTAADAVAVATRPIVGAPVVSTLHFAQPRGHDRLTRWVYSAIPRLVTAEVAISQFVADNAGGEPQVIPNGVPAPAGASSPGASDREPIVLVAQRFESEKNTAVAVRAFASSRLADDGWQLHLAGEGSERSTLETLTRSLGIAEATVFLGRVDDLDTRMARAGLFLATATAEPFGLSVVEAMAHGLPVIAADGGAHPETIGSATPETLFRSGDVDAAGMLLRRYAHDNDNDDARAELAGRVRARCQEAFTIETHVDALESLYQSILGKRRS